MPNAKSFAFLQITDMSFVKSNRPASSQFLFEMEACLSLSVINTRRRISGPGSNRPKEMGQKTGGAAIGLHPGDSQLIQDFWFSPLQEKQLSCLVRYFRNRSSVLSDLTMQCTLGQSGPTRRHRRIGITGETAVAQTFRVGEFSFGKRLLC